MKSGKFIISLDFELHWGGAEIWDIKEKSEYFLTTRKSIPQVLSLFEKFKIHATWATVGFLFAKSKEELINYAPKVKPTYKKEALNYYRLIENNEVGENEKDDPFHFAYSLIKLIANTPLQEIGSHTFSHYYCTEEGQTDDQFAADLQSAQDLAMKNLGVELKSLVFPRNQFNRKYIDVAYQKGFRVLRSNPDVWFWKNTSKFMSLARALDTLLPISSTLTFEEKKNDFQSPLLLPASRFLRPYRTSEKIFQAIKLNRILAEMEYAAKNNRVYHLWWHPHNFGYSLEENILFLETILIHYNVLSKKFGFVSSSMIEMYNG
jgi:peptidoglycan/xylan/chitin deacetylase (PgdA/CDA1 family)